MELLLDRTEAKAPHLNRSVLIAPNRRVNLAQAGHPLVTIAPRTRLGKVALDLAVQSSVATIQIIATTTYVNALTALAPPVLQFTAPPPGTQIPVDSLQTAYNQFTQQLAVLQGEAACWISTSNTTGGASIFSTLISTANMVAEINEDLAGPFTVLQTLPPNSQGWNDALQTAESLIGAELQPFISLNTALQTLSNNLNEASTTLVSAANTGVLYQLQQAYASEINALNVDISNCNDEIATDNQKIVGLGFATAPAIGVGVVGILLFWNPIGWAMITGGVAGAYFAIAEINNLKGAIAQLQTQIVEDTNWIDRDQSAAQSVSAFSQSAQGVASMNSQSQQELNTLMQLCQTLAADIRTSLTDLEQDEINDGIAEWNEVVSQAAFLSGITAYIWPTSIMLANPSNLTAAGTNAWLVSNSGAVFQYASGSGSWSSLPGSSLSVVSAGSIVAGIDGAPNNGSENSPNAYGQTFFAKQFNVGQDAWTTISTFPVAQLATDGASIWAIDQTCSNRQACLYSGSGTAWTAVGAMPNNDAPFSIAAAGGTLFAIAINARGLWLNSGGNWQQVGTATYSAVTANSSKVGLIDSSANAWVLDTASNNALTQMMGNVNTLAQAPNGDQYVTDGNLDLWHVAFPQVARTKLMSNVVCSTVSDNGAVYAIDNTGNIWLLTSLPNIRWQQLPALPS